MKTVVVTGPVCGGKSTLAALLSRQGATVVDGDGLGHQVLDLREVQAELMAAFGSGIMAGNQVDRAALGQRVFSDPGALAILNRISHPALAVMIDEELAAQAATGTSPLAVLDAAVYFLLPLHQRVDLVVTVTADPLIRLQRLLERNRLTPEDARARIKSQEAMAPDWSRADLVVVNDNGLEILEHVAVDVMRRLGLPAVGENSGPGTP